VSAGYPTDLGVLCSYGAGWFLGRRPTDGGGLPAIPGAPLSMLQYDRLQIGIGGGAKQDN